MVFFWLPRGMDILDEVLDFFSHSTSPDQDALVGPYIRQICQIQDMSDVNPVAQDNMEEILLLDIDAAQSEGLIAAFQPTNDDHLEAIAFQEGKQHAIPLPSQVLELAKEWVAANLQDRLGFYSAQEEVEAATGHPTPRRTRQSGTTPGDERNVQRKAAAKKPTVAALSGQVETLLSTLPQLTEQLTLLAVRQEQMEKAMTRAPVTMPMTPHAARGSSPVSAIFPQSPCSVPLIPELARQLGPPPRTKTSQAAPTAHLRRVPEDEPQDLAEDLDGAALEPDAQQHPYAEALLQQSRALFTLVQQLGATSSDPMTELTSTSGSLGVKGAAGREKLQRELSQQNGQFFLKVCQSIHRRQSPTSPPPSTLESLGNVSLLSYLERYGGYVVTSSMQQRRTTWEQ